jgi:hypothetical protein
VITNLDDALLILRDYAFRHRPSAVSEAIDLVMDKERKMPIEFTALYHKPEPFAHCPGCGSPRFESFLRGLVQRSRRRWWWPFQIRAHCAVICHECKEIVGWEAP